MSNAKKPISSSNQGYFSPAYFASIFESGTALSKMPCTQKLQELKAHNSPALIKKNFSSSVNFFCLKCDDELGWRNFRVFNHTPAHLPFRHPWFHATNFSIFHFLPEPKINITYTWLLHVAYLSITLDSHLLWLINLKACSSPRKKPSDC